MTDASTQWTFVQHLFHVPLAAAPAAAGPLFLIEGHLLAINELSILNDEQDLSYGDMLIDGEYTDVLAGSTAASSSTSLPSTVALSHAVLPLTHLTSASRSSSVPLSLPVCSPLPMPSPLPVPSPMLPPPPVPSSSSVPLQGLAWIRASADNCGWHPPSRYLNDEASHPLHVQYSHGVSCHESITPRNVSVTTKRAHRARGAL